MVEAEDARAATLQETRQKACSPPTFLVTAAAVAVEEEEGVFTVEPAVVALTGDVAAQVVVVVAESVDNVVAHLPTSRTRTTGGDLDGDLDMGERRELVSFVFLSLSSSHHHTL